MSSAKYVPVALVAALLGGGVVAAGVSQFDLGEKKTTTTVVRQAPLSAQAERSQGEATAGLTARDIYKRDAPGVVFIKAEIVQQTQSDDPFSFGLPQTQRGTATGSGFVVDAAGDILTNNHVIAGATKITVQLQDKRSVDAKLVGRDPSTDLALLRIDPDGLDLQPLGLGSSKGVQVGDPVVAIGNPFGLDRTLTTGVVSALQRRIEAPNGFGIDNVIQTDAAINPGNSGGPLIDSTGKVIGINSQIETGGSGSEGNVGIGFAVPIDTAEKLLPQLKAGGEVKRPYLGVESLTVDRTLGGLGVQAKAGALVQSVQSGSPAQKAGLRAGTVTAQLGDGSTAVLGGDVIVAVDGKPVSTSDGLSELIAGDKVGAKVKLSVVRRGGAKKDIEVTLAARPQSQQLTG